MTEVNENCPRFRLT